jgi:two-component system, cell cycle sensor histidine kinase and response regulator CckA
MFARGVEGVHRVVPAEDLIADIRKILEETFPKSIRIEFDTQPGLAALYGDATQFEQVLLNLCVNARDAMPLGGTLSIRAQNARPGPGSADARTDECVEIRVTDTGSGMPAEHLRKIFEPFFTTKAAGQGTGLGLSMVQTIVESHGGTVRVESKVGKGTTFIIRLPSLEGVEPKQKAQRPAELPPGHGECILVVDDEASIREMTKEMLNTFGYEVLTAGDGAEAKTVFTENHRRVGAVLVDMIMPVMEGPDCMAALRSIDPGVKIILTSGSEEHRKYCANGGDCTFLAKPYSAEKLLSTVHQAIAQSTH